MVISFKKARSFIFLELQETRKINMDAISLKNINMEAISLKKNQNIINMGVEQNKTRTDMDIYV